MSRTTHRIMTVSYTHLTGEIPSSCTDSGNLFSGCKFLSGTLTVSCTSRTTLSSSFSDAATAGTGLTIILRYDAEKSQETANTGFYGETKSADEILNALKASIDVYKRQIVYAAPECNIPKSIFL